MVVAGYQQPLQSAMVHCAKEGPAFKRQKRRRFFWMLTPACHCLKTHLKAGSPVAVLGWHWVKQSQAKPGTCVWKKATSFMWRTDFNQVLGNYGFLKLCLLVKEATVSRAKWKCYLQLWKTKMNCGETAPKSSWKTENIHFLYTILLYYDDHGGVDVYTYSM